MIGELALTASSSPGIPECVKVLSPIIAIAGNSPASAAPLAIVIEAPISTVLSRAWYGGNAPRV